MDDDEAMKGRRLRCAIGVRNGKSSGKNTGNIPRRMELVRLTSMS